MKTASVTGLQIAFLMFAVLLLAVPIGRVLLDALPWPAWAVRTVDRAIPFLLAGAILLSFPALRRLCARELAVAVPRERRTELFLVTLAHLLTAFAWAGMVVLGYWIAGGELGLGQKIRSFPSHEEQMQAAFRFDELGRSFLVGGLLGPVIEELVFRGMLYRAWERQWGWIPAMLLSAALFGIYHANFAPAFAGAIIYTCLLRRTGSLWAPIIAHSAFNMLSWYPWVGMHVFPRYLEAPGDIASWWLQLSCLLVTLVALPAYVWMSRRAHVPEAFPPTVAHGPVPT